MDVIDKGILSSLYVCSLTGQNPIEHTIRRTNLSESYIQERITVLKKNLMISENNALTEFGRSALHVVLAGGVFDIIHPGHIYTLNAAKALGDVLVVVIATGNTAVKMKKRRPLHAEEQRQELIGSLSMVDLCLIGSEGDIFKTVSRVKPDIIALGYDQVHQEKFITDGCKSLGLNVRVARLQSPIPEYSSSKIEKEYGEALHGI
ncbi:adenylyltransferase/cytidyltransferase family protein [Candidatus Nitrosotenuis aquarius]|uniref:adenylyltransferase/cytidyltransferase family protein n=1 Tax=Candidatus Nitrosotenuis aquarius TaxID=1846278 RepID=UPI000C1E6F8C|nr:adenylyltransferase/cytidyltransferase family protein [Candidatus Nitrosotenuis aquarius]